MRSGMSIGMVLISVELTLMLFIMLVLPGDLAGPVSYTHLTLPTKA